MHRKISLTDFGGHHERWEQAARHLQTTSMFLDFTCCPEYSPGVPCFTSSCYLPVSCIVVSIRRREDMTRLWSFNEGQANMITGVQEGLDQWQSTRDNATVLSHHQLLPSENRTCIFKVGITYQLQAGMWEIVQTFNEKRALLKAKIWMKTLRTARRPSEPAWCLYIISRRQCISWSKREKRPNFDHSKLRTPSWPGTVHRE